VLQIGIMAGFHVQLLWIVRNTGAKIIQTNEPEVGMCRRDYRHHEIKSLLCCLASYKFFPALSKRASIFSPGSSLVEVTGSMIMNLDC